MSAKQYITDAQKIAAWCNSGGDLCKGKPDGWGYCIWKPCEYGPMKAEEYGGDQWGSDWVVDYKIPLIRGGTNDLSNLQALHSGCHDEKVWQLMAVYK